VRREGTEKEERKEENKTKEGKGGRCKEDSRRVGNMG